jgi:hypothetical protein
LTTHALLTRFNLERPSSNGPPRHLDRDWLTGRLALFERVCAPSVAAQTVQDFTWIVFVAPDSPAWLLDELHRIVPRAVLTPVPSFRMVRDPQFVRGVVGAGEWLTSQVDSDDALARTYVERAQAHAIPGYLSFVNGVQLDLSTGWATRAVFGPNPFLTRLASDDTVFATQHAQVEPDVEIGGEPGWLQAIHGGNIVNRYADYSPFPLSEVYEHFAIAPVHERRTPFVVRRATFVGWKARRALSRRLRR